MTSEMFEYISDFSAFLNGIFELDHIRLELFGTEWYGFGYMISCKHRQFPLQSEDSLKV